MFSIAEGGGTFIHHPISSTAVVFPVSLLSGNFLKKKVILLKLAIAIVKIQTKKRDEK